MVWLAGPETPPTSEIATSTEHRQDFHRGGQDKVRQLLPLVVLQKPNVPVLPLDVGVGEGQGTITPHRRSVKVTRR